MELLEYFKSIDLNEINRFVEEGQEEHLHLEFKQATHPSKEPKALEADKKNISKCISGFANSDGGIIIWGVSTSSGKKGEPDTAKALKPISELKKFVNLLNRLEGQAVTPTPKGVIHEAIESDENEGYIKTYVPVSDNAPHMANFAEKHYYKRSGDSFYQCEHYDIRDMFQRSSRAHLVLGSWKIPYNKTIKEGLVLGKVIFLENAGKNFAKGIFMRLEVNKPYYISEYGLSGNRTVGLFNNKSTDTNRVHTYSGGQDVVIYPEMKHDIDLLEVRATESDVDQLPDIEVSYEIVAENMTRSIGIFRDRFENPWKS